MTRILGILLGSALAVVVMHPAHATGTWSAPVAASAAGQPVDTATTLTSADGTRVLAVWRNTSGAKKTVQARTSGDGGVTWSAISTLTAPSDDVDEFAAALSKDGKVAAVIWDQNSAPDVVRVAVSRDGGQAWTPGQPLNASGPSNNALSLAVSSDGSHIAAAWTQDSRAVATRSVDYGGTWPGFASTLSAVAQVTDRATVAMSSDGMTLHVGWINYTQNPDSIQMAHSTNGGGVWVIPPAGARISSNAADAFDRLYMATSSDGSHVVALWNTSSNTVAANRSENFGGSWFSGPDIPEISATGYPWALLMSADGSRVAAGVQRSDGSNNRPAVRMSSNGGTSWGSTQYASPAGTTVYGQELRMSADGDSLAALWRANTSLGISRSSDAGSTWAPTATLDATGQNTISGALSASSDLEWVNAAWIQIAGGIARAWTARSAPAPTVTAVAPNTGPLTGGTAVTITGTGFVPGAEVTIGGAAATDVVVASSTTITARTPVAAAGKANVVVTNIDNQSGTLVDGYIFAKKTQEPTKAVKFAKKVKPGKWVKVLATPVQTNAGQNAKVSASAKAKGKKVSKKYFKTRTKKGHFQVRSTGAKKLSVIVSVKAPETSEYAAYLTSKKYTVKKG